MPSETEEKEQRELENQQRLSQQSLLMLNLYNLTSLNSGTNYKNFICIEDDEPEIFMSKLMGVDMLNISHLKSHHFSSLVPEIRFFKTVPKNGQDPAGQKEITFPTHAGVEQKLRYNADLSTSFSDLTRDSSPNLGVKNVDWSFQGTTAFAEKTTLIVNVQLFAERISDLFSPVIGQGDSSLRYSDLFTLSSKYKVNKDKNNKKKEENPDHFRIKMQLGWSITSELSKFLREGENKESVERAINLLNEQKVLLDLDLTNFDLDFGQEGAVTVNLTYKSHLESQFNNPYHSNILFNEDEMKEQKRLERELQKIEKEVKDGKHKDLMKEEDPDTGEEVPANIVALKGKIANLQSDSGKIHSSIVEELLREKRVRVYKVNKEDVLYRYMYQGPASSFKDGSDEKECNVSAKPEDIDGYTYVSTIDVPSMSTEFMSTTEDQTSTPAYLKVYAKKGTTGTEKVYTYHEYFESSPATNLFEGQSSNGLITHKQLKQYSLLYGWGGQDFQERFFSTTGNEVDSEIANNPLEDPRCSVESMKGQSEKANELAKLPTQKKDDEESSDLKKFFETMSKPEFDSSTGTYSIKYFYLGDLIEIALEKLKKKNEKMWKEFRVVVTSAVFTTFSNSDQLYGFYDVDIKDGVVSITRTSKADKQVSSKAGGEKFTEIERDMKEYVRSLADIPISLSSFLHWYDQNYISKKVVNMPFTKFLRGVMELCIKSLSIVDDEFALLPKQKITVAKTMISVPKEKKGKDYFGFSNPNGNVPSDSRILYREIRKNAVPKIEKDKMKEVNTGYGKSLRESKLKFGTFNGETTDYLMLHSGPKTIPARRELDFMEDSKDGIPHFFVGGESGLLKSINFSLKENEMLRADAMLRSRTAFNNPRFPISGKYDVEITMFGNTFFQVGSVIVVNPSALRLGNVKDKNSQINELGISGYYVVTKVSNYIQAGTYETKIVATRQSPGNGFDLGGKHKTKLPTREYLDSKKKKKEDD